MGSDRRLARRVARPMSRFLRVEAASGVLLVLATIAALVWVNSPWSDSYHELWETHIDLRIGDLLTLSEPLEAWVNDALMVVFFFVVGIEIKRELVTGELRDRRAASLPAIAALGGMIVPALIFVAFNAGGDGVDGWGIPMATDIAFAVGVVSLLGDRVSSSLKIFLLTLAVVDDIGAIVVIAIFYTSDLSFGWLAVAGVTLGVIIVMRRIKIWYVPLYVLVGGFLWLAVFESGVHATIAGVVLGLLTPARPLQCDVPPREVIGTYVGPGELSAAEIQRAKFHMQETVSVAERLEVVLQPFASYLVIPIFALANAGNRDQRRVDPRGRVVVGHRGRRHRSGRRQAGRGVGVHARGGSPRPRPDARRCLPATDRRGGRLGRDRVHGLAVRHRAGLRGPGRRRAH